MQELQNHSVSVLKSFLYLFARHCLLSVALVAIN